MRARLTILIGCAAFALALPANAMASQVNVSFGSLNFFAAAGEINDVSVSFDGTDLIVTDTGSVIVPTAPECVPVSPNQVKCAAATVLEARLDLNDMSDKARIDGTVTLPGSPFSFRAGGLIYGGPGDDQITGGPNQTNFLFGSDGFGGDGGGVDTLTGGELEDSLLGEGDGDTLAGGGGADSLFGGNGSDQLGGGPGPDTAVEDVQPNGADTIDGGPGTDLIFYNRAGDVQLSLNGVADDGEAGEGDNVTGFDELYMGKGNDTVTGGPGPELISAAAGNDTASGGDGADFVAGGSGTDTLNGDGGNDTVIGDAGADMVNGGGDDDVLTDSGEFDGPDGNDVFSGGTGIDLLDYSRKGNPVVADLDGVADDGIPGETDNAGADIENLIGTLKADTLIGNDSANEIEGGGGDDTIAGLGGADALLGADGNDTIDAGPGIDLIDSGAGTDTLRSRDSDPDDVSCGSSLDTLTADLLDPLPATCDDTSLGAFIAKTKVELNEKGKGKLSVSCPLAEGIACAVGVNVGKARKALAKAKGTVASGETEKIKLKLTRDGKKALDGNDKIVAPATTTMTDAAGAQAITFTKKLVLAR